MINRKYGIGMPGNGNGGGGGGQMPTMPNTFIGTNQIAGNQQQIGQQILALPSPTQTPFGIPPWGISPTTGGQPMNVASQSQISQQMCRQMANTIGQSNGQQQQKVMPFECITSNVGTGGGKENGEEKQKQVEKQVGTTHG
jgi:hypothetical protein